MLDILLEYFLQGVSPTKQPYLFNFWINRLTRVEDHDLSCILWKTKSSIYSDTVMEVMVILFEGRLPQDYPITL